jgi:hypothetical protein
MASKEKSSDLTFQHIWSTLSQVNVEEYKKEVNGLSYLSWARAWGVLMDHFPEATYTFGENEVHLNGTVTVHCSVTIGDNTRTMWLPVMTGFKHAAKADPDARDIGDAKMRCLTKCLGMFGLGHYIYAGEDLPRAESAEEKPKAKAKPQKPKLVKSESTEVDNEAMPKPQAEKFVEIMLECLGLHEDKNSLNSYYRENIGDITKVQEQHPELYKKLMDGFTARKTAITTKGEA